MITTKVELEPMSLPQFCKLIGFSLVIEYKPCTNVWKVSIPNSKFKVMSQNGYSTYDVDPQTGDTIIEAVTKLGVLLNTFHRSERVVYVRLCNSDYPRGAEFDIPPIVTSEEKLK